MLLMAVRILSVAALLVGVVFAVVVLKKHSVSIFFKCAFLALVCQLLASLYYLTLCTTEDVNNLFTIGIFGEEAAFLFVIIANAFFIQDDELCSNRVSVPGVAAAAVVLGLLAAAVAVYPVTENIVCNALYAVTTVPCAYLCVLRMRGLKENTFRKAVSGYNLCVTVCLVLAAAAQVLSAVSCRTNGEVVTYGYYAFHTVVPVLSSVAVVLLGKGLKTWDK